jgi:hypothetical protein
MLQPERPEAGPCADPLPDRLNEHWGDGAAAGHGLLSPMGLDPGQLRLEKMYVTCIFKDVVILHLYAPATGTLVVSTNRNSVEQAHEP